MSPLNGHVQILFKVTIIFFLVKQYILEAAPTLMECHYTDNTSVIHQTGHPHDITRKPGQLASPEPHALGEFVIIMNSFNLLWFIIMNQENPT